MIQIRQSAISVRARNYWNPYKAMGGPVERIVKPGADHHPHGLTDPRPIVAFFERAWLSHGSSPLAH